MRLFGGVHTPTFKVGISEPALGPALFSSLHLAGHITHSTLSMDVPVSTLEDLTLLW